MRIKKLKFGKGFRIAINNSRSQAAEMVLEPGDKEGDSQNRHRGSDQWLFVESGNGTATINGKKYSLKKGILIFIERKDKHEIKNTGHSLLKTLNLYIPPAYTKAGDELPRGKR